MRLEDSFGDELTGHFIREGALKKNIDFINILLSEELDISDVTDMAGVLNLESIPEDLELYLTELSKDFLSDIKTYDNKKRLFKGNEVQLECEHIDDGMREAYVKVNSLIEKELLNLKDGLFDLCYKCFMISQIGLVIEVNRVEMNK